MPRIKLLCMEIGMTSALELMKSFVGNHIQGGVKN